jgi:hypothetical protein
MGGGIGGGFFGGAAAGGAASDAALTWSCQGGDNPDPTTPATACPDAAPQTGSRCDPMTNNETCDFDDGTQCTCSAGGGGGFGGGGFGGGGTGAGQWDCGDRQGTPDPTPSTMPSSPDPGPDMPQEDTQWADAFAVFSASCTGAACHSPPGRGGFSVNPDDEAATQTSATGRAMQIRGEVQRNAMPPAGSPTLSDADKTSIINWTQSL